MEYTNLDLGVDYLPYWDDETEPTETETTETETAQEIEYTEEQIQILEHYYDEQKRQQQLD